MGKNVLIIGAGAVGMVYGKYVADAGNDVTFYVREKYLVELAKGEVLYHLNKDKKLNNPIRFKNFNLISSFDEIGAKKWDQVYLCISSTALQSFDLQSLEDNLIDPSTIVMLQPSAQDFNTLCTVFPRGQIVEGMITLISYTAPLSTETAELKGIAYYLPPMMPTPFSGDKKRRDEVIKLFNQSNLSAKSSQSVQKESLFPTAFLMSFLTALESENWKFNKLKANQGLLKQLKLTTNEIFTALETKYGTKRPLPFKFISAPRMVRSLLKIAPKVMPMDIETYFEYHFMKVKDQTKLYMGNYLELAKLEKLPHANLQAFCNLT